MTDNEVIAESVVKIDSNQESVGFSKCELNKPNIRPKDLNLKLIRKVSKTNDSVKDSGSPSADSDNQSNYSTVGSDMSSPTADNSDLSEKYNQNKPNNRERVANNDRGLYNKKIRFKIYDLRPEDTEESLVSRIFSKSYIRFSINFI